MFSMSFVSRGQKSFQKRLADKAEFRTKDFEMHDLVVAPHPGQWRDAVEAVRMTWKDASGAQSVFERFERPFVFDHLPTPQPGKLAMVIDALDGQGQALGGLRAAFDVLIEDAEAASDDDDAGPSGQVEAGQDGEGLDGRVPLLGVRAHPLVGRGGQTQQRQMVGSCMQERSLAGVRR